MLLKQNFEINKPKSQYSNGLYRKLDTFYPGFFTFSLKMNNQNQHSSKFNSQVVIYTDKQRPSIFTQTYKHKNKKKTFDDLYSSPIFKQLSFLISNNEQSQCQCLNSLQQCPHFKQILKESKKPQAKIIFEQLREQSNLKHIEPNLLRIKKQIYRPHLQNLLCVIRTDRQQAIIQILKHAKNDYMTFWIYGIFCDRFPQLQTLEQNIIKIATKMNLDIDLQRLASGEHSLLKQAHQNKLFNLFPSNFPTIISLIINSLESQMMTQKLIICHFIRGRQRKQLQQIQAATQM